MMTAKHAMTAAIVVATALGAGTASAQQAAPKPTPVEKPGFPIAPSPAAIADMVKMAREAALVAGAHDVEIAMALDKAHAATMAVDAYRAGFAFDFQDRAATEAERARTREADAKQRERAREDRAYEQGYRHITESQWEQALERFNEVLAMKGSQVDAALYWKAHAQDRLGQRAEALATLATLTRDYQKSRYLQQARALEAEVRRNAGQPVRPQDQADEDLKLMAIAALQNSAPEQAIPMLEKLLQGTASPKLKERALFVLAQSNSPQAREVLKGIARGQLDARVAEPRDQLPGHARRARKPCRPGGDLHLDDRRRQQEADHPRAGMGGEKDRVFAAAQTEQNPELRAEAVRQLGMHGGQAELAQLYAKETAPEIKKQIISAMAMGGSATRLTEIARSEKDVELRRTAIRSLGMTGGAKSSDTLVELYAAERDPNMKKTIIGALGMQDNATALVAIARKEEDQTLKKEIVGRLSHMTGSKVATDYLLEILNK